jgi:hypothetical protein
MPKHHVQFWRGLRLLVCTFDKNSKSPRGAPHWRAPAGCEIKKFNLSFISQSLMTIALPLSLFMLSPTSCRVHEVLFWHGVEHLCKD